MILHFMSNVNGNYKDTKDRSEQSHGRSRLWLLHHLQLHPPNLAALLPHPGGQACWDTGYIHYSKLFEAACRA